jgi:hypothetical protein
MKYCLLLICFCSVFNVLAEQTSATDLALFKQKVDHAIIKFEETNKELWSYTISRHEDEEGDITSSIEEHLPHTSERWLLRRINGQLPTSKQIKHFAKKKQKQNNTQKPEENIRLSLRQLINPESLSLVSNNENTIVMAFDVYLEKLGEDSIGKLQGELVYKKDEQYIQQISVWNNAEFSPMFTAKITDLNITLTFVHIDGAILAKQNKMIMVGSFAYFTDINETSVDNFSDYLYQGK